MTRCSSSGSRLWESHDICENRVSFVNVKTNYRIDEDVVLDYILQEKFQSSTRDWIGIFPKNWSNLQQYLTFEYTLSAPLNSTNPLNRTTSFPRIFHREAIINLEYQFVYVSKEIQIMATSTYFRFAQSHCNNVMKRCSCLPQINTSNEMLFNMRIDEIEDTQQPPVQSVRPTCRYCHRKICGLKIDALRGDFLATFSDSLLNRVHRLERDLNFAECALKNSKGAREILAKRLQAYEAFVAEMLKSLAVRGIVKITDEKGIEIILQRVNKNDSRANNELEEEIVALKNLLKQQQQTITKLTERTKLKIPQRDRINCIDREIQTMSEIQNIEESSDDCKEENALKRIVKNKGEKLPLDVNINDKEIETIDTSKLFSKDIEESKIISRIGTEQAVLKIQKPRGILIQGKDVKFAIVRF